MSWENRDYNRAGGLGGGRGIPGVSANVPAVTMWLLGINVLVFLVDVILTPSTRGSWASPSLLGEFSFDQAVAGGQVWRFVTYQFLHAGFFHLLFNMIGLWIFGGLMERWWGSKRFLAFYLLCGVGGAVAYGLVGFVPAVAGVTTQFTLVGASGCVLGCVAGCMVKFPKEPIGLLFIPITFTIFALGAVYIGLDVLNVLAGGLGAGSAVAHLGGAVTGFALVKLPKALDWADRVSPGAIQRGVNDKRFERKQKQRDAREAELDRVLAKVKDQGLHSLTRKEKKVLQRATDDRRGGG